ERGSDKAEVGGSTPPCSTLAPVAQWKSGGLLSHWLKVRVLSGVHRWEGESPCKQQSSLSRHGSSHAGTYNLCSNGSGRSNRPSCSTASSSVRTPCQLRKRSSGKPSPSKRSKSS